jgi:hypothetical protein
MTEYVEVSGVGLSDSANAAIGACVALNDAMFEVADEMCVDCRERSDNVFEAVNELLVAIIFAVANKRQASVFVTVETNEDGSPVIDVFPDDRVKH